MYIRIFLPLSFSNNVSHEIIASLETKVLMLRELLGIEKL